MSSFILYVSTSELDRLASYWCFMQGIAQSHSSLLTVVLSGKNQVNHSLRRLRNCLLKSLIKQAFFAQDDFILVSCVSVTHPDSFYACDVAYASRLEAVLIGCRDQNVDQGFFEGQESQENKALQVNSGSVVYAFPKIVGDRTDLRLKTCSFWPCASSTSSSENAERSRHIAHGFRAVVWELIQAVLTPALFLCCPLVAPLQTRTHRFRMMDTIIIRVSQDRKSVV